MVNSIHKIPYLKAIEILFLGLPFLVHGLWGVKYALTSRWNSFQTRGNRPALPMYARNRAFTWQRVTSWLLIIGIIAHVIHMRFIEYPIKIQSHGKVFYFSILSYDAGLRLIAEKLDIIIYHQDEISDQLRMIEEERSHLENSSPRVSISDQSYDPLSELRENKDWMEFLKKISLKKGKVLVLAQNMGTAFFLILRETFISPTLVMLYSVLVIAAVYHAFNGLWTFMISWGLTLTNRSQKIMRWVIKILMTIVMFFGLIAAWGTYWTNLFLR